MKTQDIKNIARAMQQVAEKLSGGQHKLDKDKDGDIDGKDFAMMRKKKNEKVTTAAGQEVDKPIKHDCATHVEHAEWGKGQPISGMHTIVETTEGEGYVTHYDVMFEHGIEKDVSVDDLSILVSEAHGHSINASKKKKMAEDEVEVNPTLKTKKEKKGTETTTQDMGEETVIPKKFDAYKKHVKTHKLDEPSVRMIHQNPDEPESKRMMKNPKYAKAVDMYKAAHKNESVEEAMQVDEISKKTLGSYIKKAGPDAVKQTAQAKRHADAGDMADKDRDMYKAYAKSQRAMDKAKNRQKGISKAVDKLTASYKTESKNAALMKKLAKASAPSEKGKKAVSLPKAPFEIPKKEGVEWAVYNKIKENRAAHYKSATAPEEMDSKASGNEKDFKAKHKVDTMPADLEKKSHDGASAAGRVTKKAPARNGDNAAGDKIKMAVDTTKG